MDVPITVEMVLGFMNDLRDAERTIAEDLKHKARGYDLRANLGKRNRMFADVQEHLIGYWVRTKYPQTITDGRENQPDIVIPELHHKVVEVKLVSQGRQGKISLQATETELRKHPDGLDHIFCIVNATLDKCCVIYVSNLKEEDCLKGHVSSKGKLQVCTDRIVQKSIMLIGEWDSTHRRRYQACLEKIEAADQVISALDKRQDLTPEEYSQLKKAKKSKKTNRAKLPQYDADPLSPKYRANKLHPKLVSFERQEGIDRDS